MNQLFESEKKHLDFPNLTLTYRNNIKKTWEIIKKSIEKGYCNHQSFPKKLVKEKKTLFINVLLKNILILILLKLEKTLQKQLIHLQDLKKCDSIHPKNPLSVNELKGAFFSLKVSKTFGYDHINFNVVRNCFGTFLKTLIHVFKKKFSQMTSKLLQLLQYLNLLMKMKWETTGQSQFFDAFQIIQERIRYNRLSRFLTANEILYEK